MQIQVTDKNKTQCVISAIYDANLYDQCVIADFLINDYDMLQTLKNQSLLSIISELKIINLSKHHKYKLKNLIMEKSVQFKTITKTVLDFEDKVFVVDFLLFNCNIFDQNLIFPVKNFKINSDYIIGHIKNKKVHDVLLTIDEFVIKKVICELKKQNVDLFSTSAIVSKLFKYYHTLSSLEKDGLILMLKNLYLFWYWY